MEFTFSGRFGLVFLTIINSFFMLCGLGLLVPGLLLQTKVAIITDEVEPLLDQIVVSGLSAGHLVNNLSILFIIAGAFIFIVSIMGLFGAFCRIRWLLFSYAVVVLIIFIIQIVGISLWFTLQNKVEGVITDKMLELLINQYEEDSLTSQNQVSNAWNYLFITFKCCGVNAVEKNSADGGDFALSNWEKSGKRKSPQKIPVSCCTAASESEYSAPTSCTDSVTEGEYFETGCYTAVRHNFLTSEYNNIIIAAGVILLLIEIVAAIFAMMLCHQIGSLGNLA